jgi:CyaY protein
MNEHDFTRAADAELAALEAALESLDADIDIELKAGGILEIECANNRKIISKIIINRHTAAREIWVAARSGGYHFAYQDGAWISGRDGQELRTQLEHCLHEQTGDVCTLPRRPS